MFDLKSKILLVDDFKSMKKVLSKQLNALGFKNIDDASTGEDAWKMLVRAYEDNDPYKIAFLDIHMPGICGKGLLEKFKKDELFKELAVIMVSSEDSSEVIQEVLKDGADDYIIKPPELDILEIKLKRVSTLYSK